MEVLSVLAKLDGDANGMVKAFDQAGKAVGDAEKKTGLGTKAMVVGVAAAAAGIAALAYGAKKMYDVGAAFDDAKDTIIIATGASGEALSGLTDSVDNVAMRTPAAIGDVAIAIGELNTRLGTTGKPLEDMAGSMLDLTRMAGGDLKTNIGNVTRVFGDWGIAVEDQSLAMDKIFEATKRTGIGLDTLAGNVVKFGAPLRQLGFGFEESLAIFGKWEKEGVNTEVILGGVRAAIGKFAKAGEDVPSSFRNALTTIGEMESASDATGKAIEIFGQKAGADMAAAIREGRFEIDELVDGLMNAEGALDDAATRTLDLPEAFQMFKNSAMVAVKPVAEAVFGLASGAMVFLADKMADMAPLIQEAMESASPFIKGIGDAFLAVGPAILDFITTVSPLGVLFRALEPVLPVIADALAQVGAVLSGALATILPIVADLFGRLTEMLSGVLAAALPVVVDMILTLVGVFEQVLPIVLSVAGVIGNALMSVLEAVLPLLPMLQEAFFSVLEALLPLIPPILDVVLALLPLVEVAGDLIGAILPVLVELFIALLRPILGLISPLLDLLVPALEFVGWVIGVVVSAIGGLIEWFTGAGDSGASLSKALSNGFTQMGDIIGAVVNGIGSAIAWVVNAVKMNFDRALTVVKNVGAVFKSVFGAIGGFISDAFSNAISIVRGAVNGIIGLINGVIGSLNRLKVDIPDWVPLVGGSTFGVNLPTIPMLADGGRAIAPGLALVGERGPEILTLPTGAAVVPLTGADMPGASSEGTFIEVSVTVQGHVLNGSLMDDLADRVADKVRFAVGG